MNIIPWRRRNESLGLRDELTEFMNRAFGNGDWPFADHLPATFSSRSMPPLNLAETEQNYTVTLELPGMDEEDIDVELMGNQLLISGERKWEKAKEGKEFHRVESQYGSFQRTITLPQNLRLEPDSINAKFKKGLLEVTIPKLEPTPTTKIPVDS